MNNYKYKIPLIEKLLKKRDNLSLEKSQKQSFGVNPNKESFAPGHFYSVIPNLSEIKVKEKQIFTNRKNVTGVDLNEKGQINLFNRLSKYYKDLNFTENKIKNNRYYYNNPAYSYGDAIILYSMIRHFKPNKIIEIGSGFSSCVTLDTNEKFFDNKIKCVFIEPYARLLKSLLKPNDNCKIIELNLQNIPISYFKTLKKNDILFIDSTHVSKVGSDVNHLFFEIIPSLNPGVILHFHDIFHQFEYPKELIYKGFFWNENYMLRAFLEYNNSFKIIYFNDYFFNYKLSMVKRNMPLILKNSGASIWIKKVK
jgi:hypothetical protein